ncbi:MAG: prepilin-type N-terminal cleavage/methylation domain-containing protein [Phycisphaerae bacterium]|nr:prepilin-type N-terminal cleavage/methylation domain-containing protein [Phycisphaerae bacterium]
MSPSTRRAFTLIETLVVVVILAALLGIILPSLRAVREHGRLATCMSNKKQISRMTLGHLARSNRRFPSLADLPSTYEPGVLLCPRDENPFLIPAGTYPGQALDLPLSTGLNLEFAVHGIDQRNLTQPAARLVAYDGVMGDEGPIDSTEGDATEKKVTIGHIPPGNTGNVEIISVSASSIKAHLGHGDMLGRIPRDPGFGARAYVQSNFVPRHRVREGVGTAVFADWHVENIEQIEDSMFMRPDVPFATP